MSLCRRLYRALLRVYPEPFRRKFGAAMVSTFDAVAERDGALRTLVRESWDVLRTGLHQRLKRSDDTVSARPLRPERHAVELFTKDLAYAARTLLRSPVFTTVSALSLALGIGANTAIFSLVDAVVVKPMPVASPQDLVALYVTRGTERFPMNFSYPNFVDLAASADVFSDVVGFQGAPLSLDVGGDPELVWSEIVSERYFQGLGVPLARGRSFEAGDRFVAVLNYDFWQRRFDGGEGVVGGQVHLNGRAFTIVGVASRGFSGAKFLGFTPQVWVPVDAHETVWPGTSNRLTRRRGGWLNVRARLVPGVTMSEAEAALDVAASRLEAQYPEENKDWRLHALPASRKTEPVVDVEIGGVVPIASAALFAVVGIVLLIACANVASLQLARSVRRRKELAVRLSLGATRGRIVRQLLFESLLLAAAGGALGLVIGKFLLEGALRLNPVLDFSVDYGASMDARVLAFTAAVAILSGVLAGLLPALRSARSDINDAFREATPHERHTRRRRWVVIPQLALSLVALVCSAVLVQSFINVRTASPGFANEGILLASVNLGLSGYDEPAARTFHRQLLERLRSHPSVEAASLAFPLPLDAFMEGGRFFPDHADPSDEDAGMSVFHSVVDTGYFETMATALLAGRPFDARDAADSNRVAIVNETLARRFWPDGSAIGRHLRTSGDAPPIEVVGVARDGKYLTLGEEPRPYLFLPLAQYYMSPVTFIVRTGDEARSFESVLRAEVRALDPTLPVFGVKTIEEFLGRSTAGPRALALSISLFAGLALALTVIGVYGLMSFSVSQRRRDIGICMALGAGKTRVLLMFLKEAALVVGIGLAIGFPAAWASTRLVSHILVGVSGGQGVMLVAVSLALGAIAIVGSFIPSRRATQLNPIATLRHE